jgi:hypothetical protein
MTITFACPSCGRQIRVKDDAAGKSGKCNDCGSALTVPRGSSQLIARAPDEIVAARSPTPPALSGQTYAPPSQYAPASQPQIQYVPVPVPYQAVAPASAPNITVNVAQHASTHADARAVAIANARPAYANGLATAAAALAILALLFSWIPFLGLLAIPAAGLAIILAGLAFLLALFNRGAGMFRAIAGAAFALLAIIVAVASTGTAAKTIVDEANKTKSRDAAQPRALQPETQRQTTARPAVQSVKAAEPAAAHAPVTKPVASPAIDPPVDPEFAATKKFKSTLANGRQLAKLGIFPDARKHFQKIIDGAPGTEIAADAQKELDAIANKH